MRRWIVVMAVLVVAAAAAWLGSLPIGRWSGATATSAAVSPAGAASATVRPAGAASTAASPVGAASATVSPAPSQRFAVLSGVSCVRADSCVAVGSYAGPSGRRRTPLALAWNGRRWRLLGMPTVRGVLLGVSCTSASACMAVGSYTGRDGLDAAPLAETWDGRTWRVVRPARPGGVLDLAAVRCLSPAWCMAVTGYGAAEPQLTAAIQRWNGARWRVLASFGQASLNGVACLGRKTCVAVGSQSPANDSWLPFAVAWNGARWRTLPTPPGDTGNLSTSMAGVVCTGVARCLALGSGSLLDEWTGHTWTQLTTPAVGEPLSISCAGTAGCVAAGRTGGQSPGSQVLLAESWTAVAWRPLSPVRPGDQNSSNNGFFSVSCPAATACMAVGSYGPGGLASRTLAERWDGSAWHLVSTPNPG